MNLTIAYFGFVSWCVALCICMHVLYRQRQRHLVIVQQEAKRMTTALDALACEIRALRHELKSERENRIRAAAGLYGLDNLT